MATRAIIIRSAPFDTIGSLRTPVAQLIAPAFRIQLPTAICTTGTILIAADLTFANSLTEGTASASFYATECFVQAVSFAIVDV